LNGSGRNAAIVTAAVIYSALATWFGAVVFTHPTAQTKRTE
jgi:hypothetical protein